MSSSLCADSLRAYLQHLGPRFACREAGGRTWLISPYAFPDGDHIEVAVKETTRGEFLVTDLGETLRHLADLGFDPRATEKGAFLLDAILKQHHATLDRGMVTRRGGPDSLGTAVQDVLMASLALAHLVVLSRGYRPATFQEEVAILLAAKRVPVTARHVEKGRTNKKYEVDLFVPGRTRDALIQSLSPATLAGATPMVNATFRMWSDVPNERWRATVLDDRVVAWRGEDVDLLAGVSLVYRWKEQQAQMADDLIRSCLSEQDR